MGVAAPALAISVVVAGCGGSVVFEDAGGSASGGGAATIQGAGPATGQAAGPGGPASGSTSTGGHGGSGGSSSIAGSSSAASGSTGTGGAPTDGSCVAADYCACIAMPTCQVYAEDCFCSCDEPCSEPCDCDCAGGAFLECAPGSIADPGALEVGVWLMGHQNPDNHFSWVSFEPGGRLLVLDDLALAQNDPYFPCTGEGSWSIGDEPETVDVDMPCVSTSLVFGDWRPIWPDPPRAVQDAFLFDVGRGVTMAAFRFPDDTCTPNLSSCADPFAP